MKRHDIRRATALSLTLSLFASTALAQTEPPQVPPAEPPEDTQDPLTVDVEPPGAVDSEALERALEADLGIQVRVVQSSDAPFARLRIAVGEDGSVRVELVRDGRGALSRETRMPNETRQRTIAVALLAANLVRDESIELLALLRIERPGPRAEEVAPEPEVAQEPQPEAPVLPEPAPPQPPVVIVGPTPASPEPLPPAPSPPAPEDDLPHMPVGVDFVPMLGMSTAFLGRDRRNFSLGVVGSLEGAINGVSIASVLDLCLGDISGVQLAGVLAVGRMLEGAQLSSSVAITARDARGVQASVVSITGGEFLGAQLGIVGVTGSNFRGVQLGIVDVAGGSFEGAQVGIVSVAGSSFRGAQLGIVNVAGGGVEGAQVGIVNVAGGRVNGVQVGIVNVAEDADASIGLVSIYPNGRTQLRIGGDTTGVISTNLVHGARYTHSIVSVGVQPFQNRPVLLAGLGLGGRIPFNEDLHLDIEALAHAVIDPELGNAYPGLLSEVRVVFGARVFDVLGFYAGVGYQLLLGDREDGGFDGTFAETDFTSRLRGWPAITAGLQLF